MSEKKFWDNNYSQSSNDTNRFLEWYDLKRKLFFGAISENGKICEIGPGLGASVKINNISFVIDYSFALLKLIKKKHNCSVIVADVENLPVKDNVFAAVYLNDVLHHLKIEGKYMHRCEEIKRCVKVNGLIVVSDRKPDMLNKIILNINRLFRNIYIRIISRLGKKLNLLGSDEEPEMTETDCEILSNGFDIEKKCEWKSIFVFFFCGISIFFKIVLNRGKDKMIDNFFLRLSDFAEKFTPSFLKTDICLILRKKEL